MCYPVPNQLIKRHSCAFPSYVEESLATLSAQSNAAGIGAIQQKHGFLPLLVLHLSSSCLAGWLAGSNRSLRGSCWEALVFVKRTGDPLGI